MISDTVLRELVMSFGDKRFPVSLRIGISAAKLWIQNGVSDEIVDALHRQTESGSILATAESTSRANQHHIAAAE